MDRLTFKAGGTGIKKERRGARTPQRATQSKWPWREGKRSSGPHGERERSTQNKKGKKRKRESAGDIEPERGGKKNRKLRGKDFGSHVATPRRPSPSPEKRKRLITSPSPSKGSRKIPGLRIPGAARPLTLPKDESFIRGNRDKIANTEVQLTAG